MSPLVQDRLALLDKLTLDHSSHVSFEQGHCATELVSSFSYHPACLSPIPFLPRTIGSVVTREGRDGEDAARQFANSLANKEGLAVVAWRKTREPRVQVASPAARAIREAEIAHG
jgi:hypothetical protein